MIDPQPRISVCLPARNEAHTIAAALETLIGLRADGVIAQVAVVDDSFDGTAEIAKSLGAEVYDQNALMPGLGRVVGKGDAMWRSLSVLTGEILVWLDADSISISEAYVSKLAAPIQAMQADCVKARYRRPLGSDPAGGGRVNHLLARPLLRRFYPQLPLVQPLSGETAMSRELAWSLPFVCGYGVEIGLVIDAHEAGAKISEVDLGVHLHRHRSLSELGVMADEILETIMARVYGEDVPLTRPPMRAMARVSSEELFFPQPL